MGLGIIVNCKYNIFGFIKNSRIFEVHATLVVGEFHHGLMFSSSNLLDIFMRFNAYCMRPFNKLLCFPCTNTTNLPAVFLLYSRKDSSSSFTRSRKSGNRIRPCWQRLTTHHYCFPYNVHVYQSSSKHEVFSSAACLTDPFSLRGFDDWFEVLSNAPSMSKKTAKSTFLVF